MTLKTSDVSITSSSQPSLSTIYIDECSCLLISKLTDYKEIYFNIQFGDLKVRLLFGNLTINEYRLEEHKQIDLYADRENNLTCRINFDLHFNLVQFKTFLVKQQFNKHVQQEINRLKFNCSNASYTIVLVERNSDPLHLKYSYLIGRNVDHLNWIKLEQKEQQVVLNDDWKESLANFEEQLNVDQTTRNQIVMVCGGKNSGKSTLIRHLINRQFSVRPVNPNRKLFYLDLDPGQSEFTNSGQISLVEIDKPILFPTHVNVAKFKEQIVYSCSVCSTNVEDLGALYSENLAYLWTKVQQFIKPTDLIFVNTMGFVRIIGFMMLVDAIKLIRPNHLIEIKFELPDQKLKKLYDVNYSIELSAKNVFKTKGWLEFDLDLLRLRYAYLTLTNQYGVFSTRNSKMKRINAQLVYLSLIDCLLERPLNYLQPHVIRFKDVSVHLAVENQPEERLILDILNCSWIQLCRIDEERCNMNANGFKIIKTFGPNQCLGNAFIRNIDLKNKLFYLLTPERQTTIKQVNCLVKPNSINVPKEVFIPQLVYSSCEPQYIDVNF